MNITIVGRKIRFTSEGGSTHDLTHAHVKKRAEEMRGKRNLRRSSQITLQIYERALDLARANGL